MPKKPSDLTIAQATALQTAQVIPFADMWNDAFDGIVQAIPAIARIIALSSSRPKASGRPKAAVQARSPDGEQSSESPSPSAASASTEVPPLLLVRVGYRSIHQATYFLQAMLFTWEFPPESIGKWNGNEVASASELLELSLPWAAAFDIRIEVDRQQETGFKLQFFESVDRPKAEVLEPHASHTPNAPDEADESSEAAEADESDIPNNYTAPWEWDWSEVGEKAFDSATGIMAILTVGQWQARFGRRKFPGINWAITRALPFEFLPDEEKERLSTSKADRAKAEAAKRRQLRADAKAFESRAKAAALGLPLLTHDSPMIPVPESNQDPFEILNGMGMQAESESPTMEETTEAEMELGATEATMESAFSNLRGFFN